MVEITEDSEKNCYFLCIQNHQPSSHQASALHLCDFALKYLLNHLVIKQRLKVWIFQRNLPEDSPKLRKNHNPIEYVMRDTMHGKFPRAGFLKTGHFLSFR